jgi:hypothetical protein
MNIFFGTSENTVIHSCLRSYCYLGLGWGIPFHLSQPLRLRLPDKKSQAENFIYMENEYIHSI